MRHASVPPEEYEVRLRRLVDRAPGLVLLSSPPRNPGDLSGPVDDRLRAYREVVLSIAGESARVVLGGDFFAILDPEWGLAGVHPNDRGHTRMADELERRLLALLPRGALSRRRNPIAYARFGFLPRYRRTQRADRLLKRTWRGSGCSSGRPFSAWLDGEIFGFSPARCD